MSLYEKNLTSDGESEVESDWEEESGWENKESEMDDENFVLREERFDIDEEIETYNVGLRREMSFDVDEEIETYNVGPRRVYDENDSLSSIDGDEDERESFFDENDNVITSIDEDNNDLVQLSRNLISYWY